jgi:hypothetical protein
VIAKTFANTVVTVIVFLVMSISSHLR